LNYTPTISPLSESALVITLGNSISIATHHRIMQLQQHIQRQPFPGFTESIPAYTTLTICYNPVIIAEQKQRHNTLFETVKNYLTPFLSQLHDTIPEEKNIITIPLCYNGPDLEWLAQHTRLSIRHIIQLHSSNIYHVYMLGFLPGFAYLGEVDERIAAPRKATPRTSVPAGSVGIAGRQTGIYPFASPGGWQLIGQTPLQLFCPHRQQPALLQTGDRVRFQPISENELIHHQNSVYY
jgi:inhibitor of KinA